jgi:hypothetical protein
MLGIDLLTQLSMSKKKTGFSSSVIVAKVLSNLTSRCDRTYVKRKCPLCMRSVKNW